MIRIAYIFLGIILVCGVAKAQSASAAPGSPTKPSFKQEYGIIAEKNIFLKNGRPAVRPGSEVVAPPPPPTPVEKTYVLIGVAVGDQESRAYFEHSGSVEQHQAGDKIGPGTISVIQVDGIVFDSQNQQTLVKVGQDLSGAVVAVHDSTPVRSVVAAPAAVSPLPAPATGTVTPTAEANAGQAPAAAPTNGGGTDVSGLSLEERMRRRAQELRGR